LSEREILVPDLGGFKDVLIIDVLVKAGETVGPDTPLMTLETEKATMDVPAGAAGVIVRMLVKNGGTVSEGTPIAVLKVDEAKAAAPAAAAKAPAAPPARESAPAKPPASPPPAPAAAPAAIAPRAVNESGFASAHASPGVRRFARELGVDLSRVRGSGRKGRIVESDVKAYVKGLLSGGAPAAAGGALP
jgi:pyruvate dehydrogenase E2 component (dihydrolipoamide acetyltransferase)